MTGAPATASAEGVDRRRGIASRKSSAARHRRRVRFIGRFPACMLLVAWVSLAGCRNAVMERSLDAVRAERLALRQQVADLEGRNRELEISLAAALTGDPRQDIPDGGAIDLPRMTALQIHRYSRLVIESDASGILEIWLDPRDGRGRFIQMAGPLSLHLAVVTPGGDLETLLRQDLSAAEVRDAYRSFVTGTHYAFVLPVADLPQPPGAVMLVAEHFDDFTGGTAHRAAREIRVHVR